MRPPPLVYTRLRGIDVSHYQSTIDWKKCFSGSGPNTPDALVSVAVKAQEGTDLAPDDHWDRNWKGAADAGFEFRDAYLFHRPSADPIRQADLFCERIVSSGSLRAYDTVTLDLECADAPPPSIVPNAIACADRIEANLGIQIIIYTAKWFAEGLVAPGCPLAERPLWVAHYGPNEPALPSAWKDWYAWQWGADGSGIVQGIPVGDHVDHDIFFTSSLDELRARIRAMRILPVETIPRAGSEEGQVTLSSEVKSE